MTKPNYMMPHGKGPWNPTKYLANCCQDIIWSTRPGHYKTCKCGKSFVDETREYTRLAGEVIPIKKEE
jgi:hypothetical protein